MDGHDTADPRTTSPAPFHPQPVAPPVASLPDLRRASGFPSNPE
jgi:hypothetical protein